METITSKAPSPELLLISSPDCSSSSSPVPPPGSAEAATDGFVWGKFYGASCVEFCGGRIVSLPDACSTAWPRLARSVQSWSPSAPRVCPKFNRESQSVKTFKSIKWWFDDRCHATVISHHISSPHLLFAFERSLLRGILGCLSSSGRC